MLRNSLWLALSLFIFTGAAWAEPPEVARFQALAEEASGSGDAVIGLAAVLDMGPLAAWLPTDAAMDGYLGVAATADDADVRDLAIYQALRLAFGAGLTETAEELEDRLGFVEAWSIIGPFPNDGMAGLAARYAPEVDGVFEGEVDGKVVPVAWRELDRVSETGYLAVSEFARPAHAAVAYAATEFEVRRGGAAVLDLAVDGAYRAWLNGRPVASSESHLGGFFSRDRVDVELRRGTNTLLVKMASEDGPMGLHARLLDSAGDPLTVRARPARHLPETRETDAWPGATTPALRLQSALGGDADAAHLAAAAVVIRRLQPADPAQPWRAPADRALSADPAARDLARVAGVQSESWRAEELLERAAAAGDPLDRAAWALVRRSEMGVRSEEAATEVLRELVGRPEPPLLARRELARIARDRGLTHDALAQLRALAADTEYAPAVLFDLESAAREANRGDLVLDVYERILARDRATVGLYDDVAALLRTVGREDEVRALTEQLYETLPISARAAEQAAWIARGARDLDGAVAAMDRAIGLCPGDAELWAARGRFQLERGDREAAAADFRQALELRPQDTGLRDQLAVIDPVDDDFFAQYRLEPDAIRELRDRESDEPDAAYTVLADQKVTRVFDNGLATAWVQQAFHIHTRGGADDLRSLNIGYTPDSEVVQVRGVRVLKPNGAVLEVYDSRDYGSGSGPSSVYYDVRSRVLYFLSLEPDDVLVYEYTVADVAYRNLFDDYFGDFWYVQSEAPKRYARYVLHMPAGREAFTNQPSLGAWTRTPDASGGEVLVFEARDVPVVPRESYAPGPAEVRDYLSVSTYSDWDTLANWYWNLIEDQLVPGPEIAATVRELTDGLEDRRDMVAAIYGYVVRNTRYVGLEFGIHGYKPYRTTDCFHRRFGDCKDTASLMKVMLELAGIDARVALVRTRDMGRVDGFPPSLALFNHAITYVPEFDLFLDGTAGFSGSGELPSADQGASVVVVEDGRGGRLAEIPVHQAAATTNRASLEVDLRGDVPTATGSLDLTGGLAPSARVAYESPQQRRERLEVELARQVAGVRVVDATFEGVDDIETPVRIGLRLEGGDWTRSQGGHVTVLPVGPWSDFTSRYAGPSSRELPIELERTQTYDSTYRYLVPDDWVLAEPVDDIEVAGPVGTFTMQCSFEDGALETRMVLTLDTLRLPAERYGELRSFFQQVDAALGRAVRFEGGAR